MDIRTPFISDFEPTKLVDPGVRSLDNPAVAAQAYIAFDTTTSDASNDETLVQPFA